MEYGRTNWCINELITFREPKFLLELSDYYTIERKKAKEEDVTPSLYNHKTHLEHSLNFYSNKLIPGLEKEIEDYILSLNDKNINIYFEYLKSRMKGWNNYEISKEHLISVINNYNRDEEIRFNKKTEDDEKKFLEGIDTTKKHLETEERDDLMINMFLSKQNSSFPRAKTTFAHYHFYCIEGKPNLIDLDFIEEYYNINVNMVQKLRGAVENHIRLYNEGKYTTGIPAKDETTLERWSKNFQNHKLGAGTILVFIGLMAILGMITSVTTVIDWFSKKNDDQVKNEITTVPPVTIPKDTVISVQAVPVIKSDTIKTVKPDTIKNIKPVPVKAKIK